MFGLSFEKKSRIPRKEEFLTSIPTTNGVKAKRIPGNPFLIFGFDKIPLILTND